MLAGPETQPEVMEARGGDASGLEIRLAPRDVVGLYLDPPDRVLVLCVDEKSQIQALDRAPPLLPMRLGQPERRSTTTCDMAPRRSLRRLMWSQAG